MADKNSTIEEISIVQKECKKIEKLI